MTFSMNGLYASSDGIKYVIQKAFLVGLILVLCFSVGVSIYISGVHLYISLMSDVKTNPSDVTTVIGVVFSGTTLVVALFAVLSYFQNVESLNRMNTIEAEIRLNYYEMIIFKAYHTFLSVIKVSQLPDDNFNLVILDDKLYQLSRYVKASIYDKKTVDELSTVFIEIMKIGRIASCQAILTSLRESNDLKPYYTSVIHVFSKEVARYKARIS